VTGPAPGRRTTLIKHQRSINAAQRSGGSAGADISARQGSTPWCCTKCRTSQQAKARARQARIAGSVTQVLHHA